MFAAVAVDGRIYAIGGQGAAKSVPDYSQVHLQFKNNHLTEMCSSSEAGLYLMLIDSCITQLEAQGPSGTCSERE